MLRKYFIIFIILFFLIDQGSKILVVRTIPYHYSIRVIGDFLRFTHIRNPGVAFGLFSKFNSFFRNSLIFLLSLIALWVIISFYLKSEKNLVLEMGCSSILGGAFGNIFDRIIYLEVVDFIDIGIGELRWPTFNIADTLIIFGIILLFLDSLKGKKTLSKKVKK